MLVASSLGFHHLENIVQMFYLLHLKEEKLSLKNCPIQNVQWIMFILLHKIELQICQLLFRIISLKLSNHNFSKPQSTEWIQKHSFTKSFPSTNLSQFYSKKESQVRENPWLQSVHYPAILSKVSVIQVPRQLLQSCVVSLKRRWLVAERQLVSCNRYRISR